MIKDYPKWAYKYLYQIEEKHFWFKGRNKIIQAYLLKNAPNYQGKSFLEIGCGTGFVLSMLEKLQLKITGLDLHQEALDFCQRRTKAKLICKDLQNLNPGEKYDLVGVFDVLEHSSQQELFLKKINQILKKGGYVFLTVPANMLLWSKMDKISGHKLRFSKNELFGLMVRNGFKVEDISYFGFFHFFPLLFYRQIIDTLTAANPKKQEVLQYNLQVPPLIINYLFYLIFCLESYLLKHISLPIGTSLICCARKN